MTVHGCLYKIPALHYQEFMSSAMLISSWHYITVIAVHLVHSYSLIMTMFAVYGSQTFPNLSPPPSLSCFADTALSLGWLQV